MGPQFFVDGGFVCTYKGITRLLGRGSVRITPARAGKRPVTLAVAGWPGDHPRACGEKPVLVATLWSPVGSPPHTRGKGTPVIASQGTEGITPAHAGKSQAPASTPGRIWDHPRTRGEKATRRRS